MKPSRLLVLAPPPDGPERAIFDRYQESRDSGTSLRERNWEELEKQVVSMMFDHSAGKQSKFSYNPSKLCGGYRNFWNPANDCPISTGV